MFSVIIPAYNAAPYICDSIGSVLKQTVADFEIIVIDDGSVDDTKGVVNGIEDPRIRYIYQENGGVSAARNTGIMNAKGEYICFLDSDDLWKPHHLEVISRLIVKYPKSAVYLTGHEILLHNGETIQKKCAHVAEDIESDNVFKCIWEHGYFIHTNSVVCKTSVFDVAGLFEHSVKNGEDDDMWYRLFLYNSVAISSEVTTVYIRENSRATVSKIFVDDWIFLNRVEEIMVSSVISTEKKTYLKRLLEQRKLSFVRYCILNGEKKTAWKAMKQLNMRLLKPKKVIETIFALVLPSAISARAVKSREQKYYSK